MTMAMRISLRRTPGFTLMEVIVVLAILTILTGIALPVIGASLRVADTEATENEMEAIRESVITFYEDTTVMPSSLDDLVTRPGGVSGWMGPYINVGLASEPNNDYRYDAWRQLYQFLNVGPSRRTVRSWGPDRQNDGGADDDIDVIIDVTPIQRKLTQQRLNQINAAIVEYNSYFRFTTGPGDSVVDTPLLGPWANVLAQLRAKGILPNDAKYNTDAWGNAFVCGPNPVQYVTSSGP